MEEGACGLRELRRGEEELEAGAGEEDEVFQIVTEMFTSWRRWLGLNFTSGKRSWILFSVRSLVEVRVSSLPPLPDHHQPGQQEHPELCPTALSLGRPWPSSEGPQCTAQTWEPAERVSQLGILTTPDLLSGGAWEAACPRGQRPLSPLCRLEQGREPPPRGAQA